MRKKLPKGVVQSRKLMSVQEAAAFERPRWGGSLLAQDLVVRGWVSGAGLDRASLRLLDARGREIDRWDPQLDVQAWRDAVADPSVPARVEWTVRADGSKLLLARYPKLRQTEQRAVVRTLTTRAPYTKALLDAILAKQVPAAVLDSATTRRHGPRSTSGSSISPRWNRKSNQRRPRRPWPRLRRNGPPPASRPSRTNATKS